MNTSWALSVGTTQGHVNPLPHAPSPQQQRDVGIPAGTRIPGSESNAGSAVPAQAAVPALITCRETNFAEQMNGTGRG